MTHEQPRPQTPAASPPPRRGPFRWAILLGKCLVLALVVWGVHRTAIGAWSDLEQPGFAAARLDAAWLVAAACLYLAGLFPSALFWHQVLWRLGQRPSLGEAVRAYYIGHLGKYVPGKALVVILRAGLIRGTRVNTALAAVSVFYETLTMMSVGAFLAAVILAVWLPDQRGLLLLACLLSLAAGLPTLPPVFDRLVRWGGKTRLSAIASEGLRPLGYGTLARGWLLIGCGWLLAGGSLWAVLKAAGYTQPGQGLAELAVCTSAAALAVAAGFVSLIPGGFVVREAVLLGLLAAPFGRAGALVSAVLLRLVWLVAEVLISGILYVGGPFHRRELGPRDQRGSGPRSGAT
jgi:uncharacterized membrane protein YbhN (UPF0104 family)